MPRAIVHATGRGGQHHRDAADVVHTEAARGDPVCIDPKIRDAAEPAFHPGHEAPHWSEPPPITTWSFENMTIGSLAHTTTGYATTTSAAPTFDTLEHLNRCLSKEDISFVNVRGVRGRPDVDSDRCTTLTKRIYADPAAPDAIVRRAYYEGRPVEEAFEGWVLVDATADQTDPQHAVPGSQITSTRSAHGHASMNPRAQASMDDTEALLPSTEVPRRQMIALLEEAKLVLTQRGVDGEAQVAEAIEAINAVLRNIEHFKKESTSEGFGKFTEIYSRDVKEACELAVANGRDPYPLINQFPHCHETNESFDKKFQRAVESVQPQARFMAEELKNILAPYAKNSPHQRETGGEGQAMGRDPVRRELSGNWQMA